MIEIKNYNSHVFFSNIEGMILDDAYDPFKRKKYIDYVKKHKVNYIFSQDNDLENVTYFPNIEFLTIPDEAENLNSLYALKKLKGLELNAKHLSKIDLTNFPDLKYLSITYQPQNIQQIINIVGLKYLYCKQWTLQNLFVLSGFVNLETLILDFCKNLETLQGLENLKSLKNLKIDYCQKLTDIETLVNIKESLNDLKITDCNKILNYNSLEHLTSLENLHLLTFQTKKIITLDSIKFIRNLRKLECFTTNYRILDNDLSPLLELDHAEIGKYLESYNIRDKDLPKKYVMIKNSEYNVQVKHLSEIEGGKDNPDIIWADEIR